MTTSGADVAQGTRPVAWATSISPTTDSTFGQLSRFHASYSSRAAEWQHGNAAHGTELGNRNVRMTTGNEVEIDVVGTPAQLAGDPQRGDCGAAGRRMPALLDRVGDAQR